MVLNFNTGWKAIAPTVDIPHCCISKAVGEAIQKIQVLTTYLRITPGVKFEILEAVIQILSPAS